MVEVMGVVLVLVYVERGQDVRAISLRRASKQARKHCANPHMAGQLRVYVLIDLSPVCRQPRWSVGHSYVCRCSMLYYTSLHRGPHVHYVSAPA